MIAGLRNQFAVWRALRLRPAKGFVSQPEPRSMGLHSRGKQLVAGNFLFAGQLIEARGRSIWDIDEGSAAFQSEVQGFAWLDDLAAVGDANTRGRAQDWTWQWIARYGRGKGPGWTPDLAGRRLIRWINHALMLLQGRDLAASEAYYHSLTAQVVFLSRHWREAASGLPRFEALTGLISAGLALIGMEDRVPAALTALSTECAREIDSGGGIPTRNPEELLEVLTLLTWAERALVEAGQTPPEALQLALHRIAPTLRALRHSDGGLARFHGGGRGMEGRLDQALAVVGARASSMQAPSLAMGFARLSGGRTSVVIDAATPPGGRAGAMAHASTAAFEMTSGRRPVIVACGSGLPFGSEWARAGRATPSHSTLAIDGYSSSRLSAGTGKGEILADRAQVTSLRQSNSPEGAHLFMAHGGWSTTHGLGHLRDITLSVDGRKLTGIDTLAAQTVAERARFERILTEGRMEGVGYAIRFHLHPDVDATLDMGGTAISLALKSGEIWIFRHAGAAILSLEPSVYLERTRLKPRPTRQIVLSARAMEMETRIGWTLAKAQDTPLAIRDLERDDLPVPI